MGNHGLIPRGAEAAHPPGYVQATDPGAVGAFKPWWVTDDNDIPTEIVDFKIRNAGNTDWVSFVDFLTGSIIGAVDSVFGRTGVVVATEGDYSLDQLSDVVITTPGAAQYLRHDGSGFVNELISLADLGSGSPNATNFLRGDGSWQAATGATLADGNYGDIVVSSSGSILTISTGVVDTTKLGGDITAAGIALLDDANAAAQLTTLGFSAFVKTLVDDADAAAFLTTLGISAYAQTLLDDANAAAARTTLGLGLLAVKNTVAAGDIDADAVTTVKILNANVTGAKIESSVALAGSPTTTTQADTDDSTKIATTAAARDIAQYELARQEECIIVAVSDETTAITTGDAKITFHFPFKFTLSSVAAGLSTVSSSGAVTVDVNEAGSTIFSTKITIDQSEDHSKDATASVLSDAAIAAFAKMTVDIDGAGTGAKGLKLYFYGTRTP